MNPLALQQDDPLAEREGALARARAALRAERERLAADREETDRLLAEARTARDQAVRSRERARLLARRVLRRDAHRHAELRHQLETQVAGDEAERERLASLVGRLEQVRSEFHVSAAAARDRLNEGWVRLHEQQKRAADDWAEADRQSAEEHARLEHWARDLAQREKKFADDRARAEAETAGFREEAAALDVRIVNARAALAELERRRDRARAELVGVEVPAELAAGADADRREGEPEPSLAGALPEPHVRAAAEAADRRRLANEQLAALAEARAQWQHALGETVGELERLARELGERDRELDDREQRLVQADRRRRDGAYDLWQLRLHLEAWKAKLTAFEMRWHTEREQLESDYGRRVERLAERETEIAFTVDIWEKAQMRECERLRTELALWSDDRARLASAVATFDRQRYAMLEEVARLAARALAAEELVAQGAHARGSATVSRRLAVLRRWWEWRFNRHVRELDHRCAETSAERAALDDRFRALHSRLLDVTAREAAIERRSIERLDLNGAVAPAAARVVAVPPAEASELAALRAEVERLTTLLVEMELPEPPDPPAAIPAPPTPEHEPAGDLLPFDSGSWAA